MLICISLQEVLVVPAVIFVLSLVWMQLVKGHGEEEVKKGETERKINFEQAYQVCCTLCQCDVLEVVILTFRMLL